MNRFIKHVSNKLFKFKRINDSLRIGFINGRKWSDAPNAVTEEEIKNILTKKFPKSQTITVEDVSGGCGAMFNIYIESSEFKGLSIPKQHRTVYDILKDQIKNIHGLHLETKVAK